MITVRSLHLYPVKSLGRGISLPRATAGDRGFLHDRRFLVVDEEGRFLTQRVLPRMALVTVALAGDALWLTTPGAPPLDVPLAPSGGPLREVTIWRDRVLALGLGPVPARWLSEVLGRPCELVHMPDASLRATDPAYGPGLVGFADAYPFLLASLDSRAELARRGADVPMERFRPNVVVEGAAPFAEDGWKRLHIGTATFRVATRCVRCAITTVDPERGAFAGPEPLRTLAAFRAVEGGVVFGMNLVHEKTGEVSVGDEVLVEPG